MAHTDPQQRYEVGMIGLGIMGRNLLQNMTDYGCQDYQIDGSG